MTSFKTLFLFLLPLLLTATASATMLGAAGDYNLFTIGDATITELENSDAEGSVAIGGDAKLTNYAVASQRSENDSRLVVGGHLNWLNGQVGINGTGTIYAQSATLTGTTPTDFETTGSGLDFNATADYLTTASTTWGGLAATGTTTVQALGAIELNGSESDLNIFDLRGSDLFSANSISITAPTGSTVLVNISGKLSGMTNMGFDLYGIQNSNVLYNFHEADELLFNAIDIQGSVLAPQAFVDFDNGSIDGQMIAYTLGSSTNASSGEFHDVSFTGQLTSVPLPTAALLFITGILGFGGYRRKMNV